MQSRNGIKNYKSMKKRGSATVEAMIVLPFFMVAIMTLAYLVRIVFVYGAMQTSLQNVGRSISSASYFYYISGLKDYSDRLDDMGEEAGSTLEDQKDTLLGAVTSFNDALSTLQNGGDFSSGNWNETISQYSQLGSQMMDSATDAKDLIQQVLKDPKAEGKLLLTVFAQKVSYEVRKQLICLIAKEMLDAQLRNRISGNQLADVYKTLGVGKAELSFQESDIFGDKESLEFIVRYPVKTPMPFNLIPDITLSNRVKLIAWTGGRGASVRIAPEDTEASKKDSVWMQMDQDQRYWDRGLDIEKKEVQALGSAASSSGKSFMATNPKFPKVDAFIYSADCVEVYDVFTLNPFLKTYQNTPSKIKSEIKAHGKRLMDFELEDYPNAPSAPEVKRVVVVIVPENADATVDEWFQKAKVELESIGITECRLVRSYGEYHEKVETEQASPSP